MADVDVSDIDMKGMFEAKMGFSADDVPIDEAQLERFLLLCHKAYLENEGLMSTEDEDYSEEEDADVKVVKIHKGADALGMMDKLLGKGY